MWLFNWKRPTQVLKKYPLEFYVARCPVSEAMPVSNIVLETGVDVEEESEEFPSVALTLIERLLAGQQVLTEIYRCLYSSNTAKKGVSSLGESLFPKSYYEFLCVHEMADGVYFCEPDKMITKTVGMNVPATKLLLFNQGDVCFYWAHVYSALPDFSDFNSVKSHIESTPCSLLVEYERYPDIVRITANSEEISLECLVDLIKGVCEDKNIPLRIDRSVFAE